ncbi:hypothetical protein C8R45DRAFT_1165237 [Mycena sanguinolenta]|nr:hypothetical protein C8R45DRAFT_1165237 [Mycena sanguinolenta]
MTFNSFAILAALLAVPAAQAAGTAQTCSEMGTVSLFWGTTTESILTATPIGFSTSAGAPTDASGNSVLAVQASPSATLFGAFDCVGRGGGAPGGVAKRSNGPSAGGGGAAGGGGPGAAGGGGGATGTGGATGGLVNFFGAIADSASNLCLTANLADLNNMTIIQAPCIQPLTLVPDPSQAWQWVTDESAHVVVANKLDQLAFIGTQASEVLAIGSTTNYVPTVVGTGAGSFVALELDAGAVNPADTDTVSGLLISFVSVS